MSSNRNLDSDLDRMSKEQLVAAVKSLRKGIRAHRDSSRQELCWHHPDLWALLPEKTDPLPVVPDWPQFMRGCVKYRQSLDEQAANAPREPAARPAKPEATRPAWVTDAGTGLRVLIVDDNQDQADSQAEVLRLMGHDAEVAYTGGAALERAAAFAPQLFLLDLGLPDMDGYELVRRLRAIAHREAHFVALTGYAPGAGGNLADKLFDEHVVKPIAPEMLEEVIRRVPREDAGA